jgi:hypothetical protein
MRRSDKTRHANGFRRQRVKRGGDLDSKTLGRQINWET